MAAKEPYMTVWQILGIEPTDNIRAIKRAYAARSAAVHPEEHPEAFQQLHEAYQEALERAEFIKAHPPLDRQEAAEQETPQATTSQPTAPTPQQGTTQPSVPQQEAAPPSDPSPAAPFPQPEAQPSVLNQQFVRKVYDADYEKRGAVSQQTAAVMQRLYELYFSRANYADYQQLFRSPAVAELLDEPYFMQSLLQFMRQHEPDKDFFDGVFNAYGFTYYNAEEQSLRYELYRYITYIYSKKTKYRSAFRKSEKRRKREKANKICFIVFSVLYALWMLLLGVLFATDEELAGDTVMMEITFGVFYSLIALIWWTIVLAVMKKNNR